MASTRRVIPGAPQISDEQRQLDTMLREEARKRDYGDGAPKWSVYYHGKREAPQPGHMTTQPAISRAARESLRSSSAKKEDMIHNYRVSHANLVADTVGRLTSNPDTSERIDPTEAAAQALIEACDVDGDGMLDLFEIIKALVHRPHLLIPLGLSPGSTEFQVLEVIKKADEDSSGHVEKAELKAFLVANRHGKRGLEGMDQGYKAFDGDLNHVDPTVPNRSFGEPLVSRPGTREIGVAKRRYPQNHVCRNEFFTKGEMPGENADVMAARYYKDVGRPFEGQPMIKTCQKPRMMGKGKEWESEIQPTSNPFRRGVAFSNTLRK